MTPESKALIDQHLKYMRYTGNILLTLIALFIGYIGKGLFNKDILVILVGTEAALILSVMFLVVYCARVTITTYLLTEAKDV